MINPKIFNAVLMAATKETKDLVLKALVEHIGRNYDYNDQKVGHIVDMLVDKNAIITPDKVNLKWVEEHKDMLMYEPNKYNIRNISIDSVDNIDCSVRINFEYIKKTEDKEDVSYISSKSDINFNYYPEILKQVKYLQILLLYQYYLIYLYPYIIFNYIDMEEEQIAEMDFETVNQDFDDIDLFGTKMIEDDDDCDIEFE